MVRAHLKQTPEDKKKATVKKKAETGSWPCKISGCSKVFAREADLKRHQRTTKLHSMPGFACPQCEATFTRTDALRRHQKSRHNGVVIEPIDQDRAKSEAGSDEEGTSPKQKPKSRNGTSPDTSSVTSPPQGIPHTLPFPPNSHYYRQHTMPTGYPPPGVMIDPHYQPIGLPTSATRGSWHPTAPPWTDGPVYIPGYYHSSPYYRPPVGSLPPQGYGSSSRHANEHEVSASRSRQRSVSSRGSEDDSGDERPAKKVRSPSPRSAAPVIDPSLQNSSHVRAEPAKPLEEDGAAAVSMEMARDALLAVIDSSKRAEELRKEKGDAADRNGPQGSESGEPGVRSAEPGRQENLDELRDDLEEEGQEMGLSELLTQESLASPPPSGIV